MAQMRKNIFSKRLQAGFLIIAFAFLTGFAPILHSHDFDFEEAHQDCAPCQWSQDNVGSEFLCVSLSFSPSIQSYFVSCIKSVIYDDSHPVLNKSPPTIL